MSWIRTCLSTFLAAALCLLSWPGLAQSRGGARVVSVG